LLFPKNIITLLLFAEQEGVFAGESWYVIGSLNLIINKSMPGPFDFTRTMPEVDGISVVFT